MNILYTITAYPPSVGGAQLHLHELAKQVAQAHRAGVLYHWNDTRTDWLFGTTLRAPYHEESVALVDGVPTAGISLTPMQRRHLAPWVYGYWLAQGAALDRLSSAFVERMRHAARSVLAAPPMLIHNSRVGREALTAASLAYARQLGVPFVLTPNHHHHWRGWRYRHYLSMYRHADAVIAYTQVEQMMLRELGVRDDRIHVLGIGPVLAPTHDGDRFRQQHHIPDDVPLILYLGQKYRYKRFELLLSAMPSVWRAHPNARAVFVGPRTRESRSVFARVNDPRILELDTVDLQTKTDALAACSVLCVPSAKESFGGVYVEAWTLGKPVIGGDAPAVREVIQNGVDGYTVGDRLDDLAARLLALLNDPDRAASMGQAGCQKAQQYQWHTLATKLMAIYTALS